MGKRALAGIFSVVFVLASAAPAAAQTAGGLLRRLLAPPPQAAPSGSPAAGGTQESNQVPPDSGSGRRVVYSNSQQRVWLIEDGEAVTRTYAVSGRQGVPAPGAYRVFSRSETARARSGATMQHMVRFARTPDLAIGFHAIPRGRRGPVQGEQELGQFRSLGCVRQAPGDAAFLWDWALIGTQVIVTP